MDKLNLNILDVLIQLPCNVYWVDKHGVTLGCNQNVADFLKLKSVDDVIGKSHQELYSKKEADHFDAVMHRVIQTNKPIQIQEYVKLGDGKTYCFQSYKAPLKNNVGETVGIIGVSFDITQDKTEINFLKHIIAMLPGHVWWSDRDGLLLGANQQMASTFGFSSVDEILGQDIKDLLTNTVNDLDKKALSLKTSINDLNIIETGKSIDIEETVKINGKVHSYLSSKAPLIDLDGNTIGVMGVSQDITKSKNEREVLKHILALMPGHVWWTDQSGMILGSNNTMAQRFGFKKASDLIGKTTFDLLSDDISYEEKIKLAEEVDSVDRQVMISEKPFYGEESVEIKGQLKTFYSSKSPLKNLDDHVTGIVGISQDITDLKAAQARAEHASQVKSEFIANMSHDFRTPITGMLGEAEYIEMNASESEVRECGRYLREATQQLLRLTNDILEFVSLESGNFEELESTFDPAEILEQVITLMRVSMRNKSLKFHLKVDADVPKVVKGYVSFFERIVNNLVANAIKFTPSGSVTLYLSAFSHASDEVTLKLVVEDTGIGIPANKYSEIFEQFSKISSSYQGVFEGSGLGLYSVKQYVDKMQGEIKVDSIVGKGSKFIVTLPFDKAEAAEMVTIDFKGSASKPPVALVTDQSCEVQQLHPAHNKIAKVLVVEDAPLPARAVIRLLHDYNCEVKLVKTGEEGVKAALKKRYDLILMDIGLPQMDGIEATRQIRALPKHNDVPIIALTGHIRGDKKPECIEAGMQEVYAKPLTRQQLKSMMKTYVENYSLQGKDAMQSPLDKHILDIDAMMEQFLTNDPAQLLDMFEVAIDYMPEEHKKLERAVEAEDMGAIKASVHSLKGGVAYISAPECNDLISNWDEILRHERPSKAALKAMSDQIGVALKELCDAMKHAVELVNKGDK